MDGFFKEGERLPTERELAQGYQVSRSTVREALYELELKNLVERTRRRGTIVSDLSSRVSTSEALLSRLTQPARELAEVLDFRAALEPPMAARAARYATGAEVAELERLLEAMSASKSAERDVELDERFHALIARATHNPLFEQVVEHMSRWLRDVRQNQLGLTDRERVAVMRGHTDIVDAIRARDPEEAARVMAEHVELVRRAMWPLVRGDGLR